MKKTTYLIKLCAVFILMEPGHVLAVWKLEQAIGTTDKFHLYGEHRVRWENLDNQYRVARRGGDQALVFRTLLKADLVFDSVRWVAEAIDSRSEFTDSGTPLTTNVVNPIDLLQAYVEMPLTINQSNRSEVSVKIGRFTMDVGSRRFVARNRFRNTINNFTGIDINWTREKTSYLRAFYTWPVHRLVDGELLDNRAAFDQEDEEVMFGGIYFSPLYAFLNSQSEFYLFALDEEDTPRRATRNREIVTAGFRVWKKAKPWQFDYEIESVYQWGHSRSSTTSTIDLQHKAYFQHAEIGYTLGKRDQWQPRLLFQYDYASGDSSLVDTVNNRFDTLYGARRFDFGPTSIFGAFARSNLSSPGLRLQLKPFSAVSFFTALRAFWRASSNDAWTTAGITSIAGREDSYIGTQLEARLRWQLIPGNLKTEAGFAHLFRGDLMKAAGKSDSHYLYTQFILSF